MNVLYEIVFSWSAWTHVSVKPHTFCEMLPKLLVSSLGQSVPDLSTPSQISKSSWTAVLLRCFSLSVLQTPRLGLFVSLMNVRVLLQSHAVTVVCAFFPLYSSCVIGMWQQNRAKSVINQAIKTWSLSERSRWFLMISDISEYWQNPKAP